MCCFYNQSCFNAVDQVHVVPIHTVSDSTVDSPKKATLTLQQLVQPVMPASEEHQLSNANEGTRGNRRLESERLLDTSVETDSD